MGAARPKKAETRKFSKCRAETKEKKETKKKLLEGNQELLLDRL
jgi:hypothetical protein